MTDNAESGGGIAIYIHIPFCERKCLYCDFNSGVYVQESRERYVQALIREITSCNSTAQSVRSVYFGGGTPSVLPAASITNVLQALRDTWCFTAGAEITVECNPGTLATRRFSGETSDVFFDSLHNSGVNRLSIGVQSFDPALLERLGRIHGPEQALQTIEAARAAGFTNINLDLMFGIPGQSPIAWADTLAQAVATEVPHISAYSLIIEPGTMFAEWDAKGLLSRPDDDECALYFEMAIDTLATAGYDQYEVSAFAKPGNQCAHNLVYWRNEEYLGFGSGAASYMNGTRFSREPTLERYIRLAENGDDTVAESETLGRQETMGETMMMGLRMMDGVNRATFRARFGVEPLDIFRDDIERLEDAGLLYVSENSIRLTRRGLLLANEVWEAFV